MKTVFFTMLLSLSSMLVAGEQYLMKATSDVDPVVGSLYVVTNDMDEATALKIKYNDGSAPDVYNPNKLPKGIVLKKSGDRDVVILKSDDFLEDRGGYFEIEFLSNGITGSTEDFEVKAELNNGKWEVLNKGKKITQMHFVGKKVLGKVIGIKKVVLK